MAAKVWTAPELTVELDDLRKSVTALSRRLLRPEAGAARHLRTAAQRSGTGREHPGRSWDCWDICLCPKGARTRNGLVRLFADDAGGAQVSRPGARERVPPRGGRGLPRSLASGPSPGTQPRPRNPPPRCGGITDPRRTDHQSRTHTATTPAQSRSSRTARALADARPHPSRPPLLPLPRPLRPQLPRRRLDGSPTRLQAPATHRNAWPVPSRPDPVAAAPPPAPPAPAWAGPPGFTWRVEEGSVRGASSGLPSSKAQAGSGKLAGGGAAACWSPRTNK
jgi:hypothetical protein